ncbi:MAG: hypothetical protein ACXVJD_00600 [Mucilaginibacter sp.]
MKQRLFTLALLIVFGVAKTFAQTTATVNLNITLSDVLSLTVPTTSLSLNFDSEAKYSDGITTTVDNHLNVLSSRNYKISVQAGTITGSSSLPANSVKLQAAAGSSGGVFSGVASYPIVPLSTTTPADLVVSSASTFGTQSRTFYEVIYTVGANNAYAGKTTASDNVIPVTYTLTQP